MLLSSLNVLSSVSFNQDARDKDMKMGLAKDQTQSKDTLKNGRDESHYNSLDRRRRAASPYASHSLTHSLLSRSSSPSIFLIQVGKGLETRAGRRERE